MKKTLYFTDTEHEQLTWLSRHFIEKDSAIVRRLIAAEYIDEHPDMVDMHMADLDKIPHPANAPAVPLVTVAPSCPHPPEAQQVVMHQRPNDGPDEGETRLECTNCGEVLS